MLKLIIIFANYILLITTSRGFWVLYGDEREKRYLVAAIIIDVIAYLCIPVFLAIYLGIIK